MHRPTRIRSMGRLAPAGPAPPLLTMFCMLVVFGMLISVSSRPSTWRWLVHDSAEDPVESQRDQHPNAPPSPGDAAPPDTLVSPGTVVSQAATVPPETLMSGPTDLDAQESESAEREFQAVTDREPLAAEEMPAYWRLLRWSGSQPFDELRSR